MRYDLVIFDLDGTILNTLDDLADACNAAMRQFSYPTHSVDAVRTMVGGGVGKLIRRAVPEETSQADYEATLGWFRKYYSAHDEIKTAPYPGIPELLADLRTAGVHVACNSNKFDAAVQNLCKRYLSPSIEFAVGERENIPRKPAPDAVYEILKHFQIEKSRALYVGDSDVDLLTAKNAGIDGAWVSWGFRKRHELGSAEVRYKFDDCESLKAFILK